MKLKQYKYERVEIDSIEFEIPTVPTYYFQTGIRRAIRVVPQFTTWKKNEGLQQEELYALIVTFVYSSFECKIEKFNISVNRIEEKYFSEKDKLGEFVKDWINGDLHSRTKEQFDADFNDVIGDLNK